MCGIVGYVGKNNAKTVVLEGLEKLEYRGYDSAGIAVVKDGALKVEKRCGKLQNLIEHLQTIDMNSDVGIGHTRWATHGEPSDINSHPHFSMDKKIAVVHNGIIENYLPLKNELIEKGYRFISETDTEVVVHLIDSMYNGDMLKTVAEVVKVLKGSYALAILDVNNPEEIICTRKDSPLVIGIGEGENIIASDIPALLKYTNKVVYLNDFEIATVRKNKVEVFDKELNAIQFEVKVVDWSYDQATKNGFPNYMLKEIHEQSSIVQKMLSSYLNGGDFTFANLFSTIDLKRYTKIHLVACGTAYHVGLQAKYFFNEISKMDAKVEIASEYRYQNNFIDDRTLAIFISQSGETLDTISALKKAKEEGATTLAITNVVGSTITREADITLYTLAGPEIAVASTKAYTSQVLVMYLFSLFLAEKIGKLERKEEKIAELKRLCELLKVENEDEIKFSEIVKKLENAKDAFFIGRGIDYYSSLEGALKLKEISYIHTEAFPAGELKHGSIALIEEGTPVIVVGTQDNLIEKTISNLKELKARGAYIISIGKKEYEDMKNSSDIFIGVDVVSQILSIFSVIVPMQLIACYTSMKKGLDVDKPRNLAKSVTVE